MQETNQISSKFSFTGKPYDPVAAILYGQFIVAYAMYHADLRYENPTGFLAPGLGVFGGLIPARREICKVFDFFSDSFSP